ncbi:hypothetical protein NPIL_672121 [Nephila pilipes]|uniref:Uncharacterized protein n=1 Tax=Nephila pilipes TaxID=299642 RepID=A0A8X6TLL0_NEPPI|nr:hypothetical protein NPIL_672121 [Nephila pilipes]
MHLNNSQIPKLGLKNQNTNLALIKSVLEPRLKIYFTLSEQLTYEANDGSIGSFLSYPGVHESRLGIAGPQQKAIFHENGPIIAIGITSSAEARVVPGLKGWKTPPLIRHCDKIPK